jgi:hypothetical protein
LDLQKKRAYCDSLVSGPHFNSLLIRHVPELVKSTADRQVFFI